LGRLYVRWRESARERSIAESLNRSALPLDTQGRTLIALKPYHIRPTDDANEKPAEPGEQKHGHDADHPPRPQVNPTHDRQHNDKDCVKGKEETPQRHLAAHSAAEQPHHDHDKRNSSEHEKELTGSAGRFPRGLPGRVVLPPFTEPVANSTEGVLQLRRVD